MQSFIYWVFILATTLSKLHEVHSKDNHTIEILFVNDMQYGFYPIDAEGNACLDSYDQHCKGGLARMVQSLENSYPLPTTTTTPTTSPTTTTPTTSPTTTTPTTSPTTTTPTTSPTTTTPTTSPTTTTPTTSPTTTTPTTSSKPKNITNKTSTSSAIGIENIEFGGSYQMVEGYDASDQIFFPNNTLFLNAGNYLHSLSNNWFDLLKYHPAEDALNSLPFSAIAMGPDVLQYGEKRAMDFLSRVRCPVLAANVQKSSKEDLVKSKSKTFPILGVDVIVIGFLGKFDKEKYYGRINISEAKNAVEAEIKRQKTERKQIFIAIGTADDELAKEIAKIDGMNIVIYSGSNTTEDILQNVTKTSWIATTKPPAAKEAHGLIGKISISLSQTLDISDVKMENISYRDEKKATDDNIEKVEKDGFDLLENARNKALAKTQIALGGNESCSALEYVLGDLVTDAMKRTMEDQGTEDGIAVWNLQNRPPLIENGSDVTEEGLYGLLGKRNDENMYVVPMSPKEIASLLEESIDHLDKKDCRSLQISGLYVDYGSWKSKGKKIKRMRLLTSKGLQDLDLKGKTELKVIIPSHLMNKLSLPSEMEASDLGISVGEAVIEHINKTKFKSNHLYLSPLGFRFTDVKPPPEIKKCHDNAGEAVILTLAVLVMIGALGLLTWYFIIPRIRQRRGSTMPLIY